MKRYKIKKWMIIIMIIGLLIWSRNFIGGIIAPITVTNLNSDFGPFSLNMTYEEVLAYYDESSHEYELYEDEDDSVYILNDKQEKVTLWFDGKSLESRIISIVTSNPTHSVFGIHPGQSKDEMKKIYFLKGLYHKPTVPSGIFTYGKGIINYDIGLYSNVETLTVSIADKLNVLFYFIN